MKCPEWLQKAVERAGGTNRYGEPNFLIAWSGDETFRAGGVWPTEKYAGYREVYSANCSLLAPNPGYWMLMEWTPPEQYGTEEVFRFTNRDETTGLIPMGKYPRKGRYVMVVKLVWSYVQNGRVCIEPWPLTSIVVQRILPTIRQAKQTSFKRRMAFFNGQQAIADRRLESRIDSMMNDSKRPLMSLQKIEDRIRLLEKQWTNPSRFRPGFQQT